MRANLLFLLICSWLFPQAANAAAIHDATRKGDVAAIAAALDSGADVNESDGLVTPLYIAATRGNLEAARLLVKRGADVNLPAKFGTPLYAAAKFSQAEIVALLLVNGAKPNVTTKSLTPLHATADSGCLACVIHLVEAGADVNALTSEREPAIHFAKRNGHQDIVAYLRDHGAEKLSVPPISALLAKADPKSGEELFRLNCAGCHLLTGVLNTVGPKLWGVVARQKASAEDFNYSPALREESGTWTYEALNIFISDPRARRTRNGHEIPRTARRKAAGGRYRLPANLERYSPATAGTVGTPRPLEEPAAPLNMSLLAHLGAALDLRMMAETVLLNVMRAFFGRAIAG